MPSYGADESDEEPEEEQIDESRHIDRQNLTCNLCERRFNSTAILEKHVQLSDLHKVSTEQAVCNVANLGPRILS